MEYYDIAKERYARYGIDTEKAIRETADIPVSVPFPYTAGRATTSSVLTAAERRPAAYRPQATIRDGRETSRS